MNFLLDKPGETHEKRQRYDTTVEEIEPAGSKVRSCREMGWIVDTKCADDISRVCSEGVVQPDYLTGALELFEAFQNKLFGEFDDHGLQFGDTGPGEVRVEWLSPLAVKFMCHSRQMRPLEVDNTIYETFISVRWSDRACDIELIVIFGVADGKLVRVNPYNRS